MAVLRSTLYQIFLAVTVIPYAIACLLWWPLPLHWRYKLTIGWPRLGIWGAKVILGIRWELKGAENFPDGPAVMLSKHQSAWETMFIIGYMPRDMCFVYKRELHRIPFFGWGLAQLRMIPIDRAKGRDAFEQVVKIGQERINEGRWPILFPEGTRMLPGKTGRYKLGGALLATRTNTPVIPVAHNAGECWPRNAFIKKPGLITVSIGPLIETAGLDADAVNRKVQEWIESEMRILNPERYGPD
ncbi:1-acyl-sn-glycerol-3-phosphate acyltransferase [Pollutimonas nitritireducens]|uniref:1-acyl-sn-glycerol-3-phosphate acyltransferase n=1 Tax=Pollutimonas nitritireducens TaxID=2045209 RepID=A0A2N4UK65_9BURK|nr:lysophospholipid acyltransferase family protein [Pollutimonas nitritireducens]PLC55400.1 1-acyl-sn-glycerol-3-phosphate acyltransferase [Pollutimonas nitritireducens]